VVTVGVGAGGQIDLYNDRGYVEVVDAMGWFDGVTPTGSLVPCPNAPPPPVGTWDVCHEVPGSITGWEPDIPLGATADLTGYLYVKSIFATNGTTYPFTFRSIAYSTGSSGTSAWKCNVTVQIPVGYGPNQVEPLPSSFPYSQGVVRDASGTPARPSSGCHPCPVRWCGGPRGAHQCADADAAREDLIALRALIRTSLSVPAGAR
jgi:hypothetical protein